MAITLHQPYCLYSIISSLTWPNLNKTTKIRRNWLEGWAAKKGDGQNRKLTNFQCRIFWNGTKFLARNEQRFMILWPRKRRNFLFFVCEFSKSLSIKIWMKNIFRGRIKKWLTSDFYTLRSSPERRRGSLARFWPEGVQ